MPIAEKIAGICDRLGDIKLSIRLNKSLMRKKPDKLEIESFIEGITPAIERGTAVALLERWTIYYTYTYLVCLKFIIILFFMPCRVCKFHK